MDGASLEHRDVHLRDLLIPKMEMAENLFWMLLANVGTAKFSITRFALPVI